MTIRITDRTTGETYEAHCVEDCRDNTDAILYRMAEAYNQRIDIKYAVAEIVEG